MKTRKRKGKNQGLDEFIKRKYSDEFLKNTSDRSERRKLRFK